MKRFAVVMFICLLPAPVLSAQEDCPAWIQTAVESAQEKCADTGVGQVCYGSGVIELDTRPDVEDVLPFAKPGAVFNVGQVQNLSLTYDTDTFSVAVMRPRANLPETGVTLVVFGDVVLHNASDKGSDFVPVAVTVNTPYGANVRLSPAEDAAVVGQLATGQTVIADGQLADESWLRLLSGGWVATALVESDADFSLLEIVPAEENPPGDASLNEGSIYGAMQTFRFRSGVDDALCINAPDSGIMVQTPLHSSANLLVNDIAIVFTGTLYLQSPPTGETIISVLEGELLSYPTAETGTRLQLQQRDENPTLLALPEEYQYIRARYLPVTLLPREIDLPFALGGVIEPFIPGTGFLTDVKRGDPCVVVWTVDVNLRSGPGIAYPLRQGVLANYAAYPDGLTTGLDGTLWYRLSEAIWVNSRIVTPAGACIELPQLLPPPLPESEE
jgi:uncharacterized protein YraI